MTVDVSVGKRISMLRMLLILFVVLLHIGGTSLAQVNYSDSLQVLRFIFQDEMGRLSVPTLTLISGYLLFSMKLDQSPLKLYKKKFKTLVIPFFFFNVLYFVSQYVIQKYTGYAPLYDILSESNSRILDFVIGYDMMPFNGALHFLRDLFILVLLAPIFGFFMRKYPAVGAIVVLSIFMSDMDGHLINRNTMAVLFYIGGLIATSNVDVKKYDHLGKYSLILLFITCLGTLYYRYDSYVYVYLTAPFAVWPASVLLLNTQFGEWLEKKSKYSFFLFLAHMPLQRVIDLGIHKFFPWMSQGVFTVVTFLATIFIAFVVYDVAVKIMPTTFCFMIGGRVDAKKRKKNVAIVTPDTTLAA